MPALVYCWLSTSKGARLNKQQNNIFFLCVFGKARRNPFSCCLFLLLLICHSCGIPLLENERWQGKPPGGQLNCLWAWHKLFMCLWLTGWVLTVGNEIHSSCLPATCKLDYIQYHLVGTLSECTVQSYEYILFSFLFVFISEFLALSVWGWATRNKIRVLSLVSPNG